MSEPTLRKNEDESRYEVLIGNELAGLIDYRVRPRGIVLPHTEVAPQFGGQGLATKLAHFALADIRAMGQQVIPLCPFVANYLKAHPEELDLVEASYR